MPKTKTNPFIDSEAIEDNSIESGESDVGGESEPEIVIPVIQPKAGNSKGGQKREAKQKGPAKKKVKVDDSAQYDLVFDVPPEEKETLTNKVRFGEKIFNYYEFI